MGKKRTSKFDSARKDPLLQGAQGLIFDNMKPEDVFELTDAQKATKFLSKYMEVIDPFVTYKEYFQASAKGEAWDMKDVKTQYVALVLKGNWSEEKYVTVINDIFENGAVFSPLTLDFRGRMYEAGQLASQKRQSTRRRRN